VTDERAHFAAMVGGDTEIEAFARALLAGDRRRLDAKLAVAGLVSPVVRVDPPLDSLECPAHAGLMRYWMAVKGAAELPPRSAIDPLAVRVPVGNLMLLETGASGWDYVYRVYGGTIATHAFKDWTGWSAGSMALKLGSPTGDFYRTSYAVCAITRRPVYTRHIAPPWLMASGWRRLIVPFAGDDGNASWFMVANLPEDIHELDDARLAERDRRIGPRDPES
jgi:hypothetical protein